MKIHNVHQQILYFLIPLIYIVFTVSYTYSENIGNSASFWMTTPDFYPFNMIFKKKENIFTKKIFNFGGEIQHQQLQAKESLTDEYLTDTVDDNFGYYLQIGVLRKNLTEKEIRHVYRFIPAHWKVKKVRDDVKETYTYLTGFFRTYPEAMKAASKLKKNGANCLVVAYSGTKKLTLYQARKREVLLENMIKNE